MPPSHLLIGAPLQALHSGQHPKGRQAGKHGPGHLLQPKPHAARAGSGATAARRAAASAAAEMPGTGAAGPRKHACNHTYLLQSM